MHFAEESMDYERERMRLAELYTAMNHDELEAIVKDWDSLTGVAQQALRGEMTRRGMNLENEDHICTEGNAGVLVDAVTVAEFSELGEAVLAQGLLASGGIPSALLDVDDRPLDPDWFSRLSDCGLSHFPGVHAGIKLQVNAADAEAARDVLDAAVRDDPDAE
jgi:hypothetical protein